MRFETFALKSLSIDSTDMATLLIRGETPGFPELFKRTIVYQALNTPLNPWVLEFKVTRDALLGNALDASAGLGMNAFGYAETDSSSGTGRPASGLTLSQRSIPRLRMVEATPASSNGGRRFCFHRRTASKTSVSVGTDRLSVLRTSAANITVAMTSAWSVFTLMNRSVVFSIIGIHLSSEA